MACMARMKPSPLSLSTLILSLREFARNPAVRRKALREQKPIIIEQSRNESFFVLLPPALYDTLFELYRDLRDSRDLMEATQQETEWYDWKTVKKEIRA